MDITFEPLGRIDIDGPHTFAAKLENDTIGFIYGYSLARIDEKPPMFFIYSADIYPPHQGKGYGSRFMQFVVSWAQENGFSESFVMTERDNIAACRAYEKAGMIHNENDCDRLYVIEYGDDL
ncbi:MAG: GNAT family N-acetyltransferase [Defluviitaleaceae bacterium]|nr:GNAT family N-acetyltransferase [Defluviitaleaceae bacterium]